MFYCKQCAEKHKWPNSFSVSYGRCEMCEEVAECYDTPSSRLPRKFVDPFDDPFDEVETQQE